jgi:hypothetical protein
MIDVTTRKQLTITELCLLDGILTSMHKDKPLNRYLDYRQLVRDEIWHRLGPIFAEEPKE